MSKGTELEFTTKDDSWPLIPEGKYEASLVKYEKRKFFSGEKLYCIFQILDLGPYCGTKLFKSYNFYNPLPRGADLFKDFALVYGRRLTKKTKLSMKLFEGRVFVVRVRTVIADRKQSTLSEQQRYSVIDRIVEVLTGGKVA